MKNKLYNLYLYLKKDFILKIALFIFIVVVFVFNESGYMPVATLVLFGIFFIRHSNCITKFKLPTELKLLNVWIIWALVTGLFVSVNTDMFLKSFFSVFFLVLTVNMLFFILSYDIKNLIVIIFAIFLCGLIQIVAIRYGFQSEEVLEGEREYGLAGNPNSFGLKLVYSSIAICLFLGKDKFKLNLKLIISVFLYFLFMEGIFASGSRKSALSLLLFTIGFIGIYYVNKRNVVKISNILLLVLVLFLISQLFLPYIIEGTMLQTRFQMLEEAGGIAGDIRYQMYKFGMDLFAQHPIFGVGLNNYRMYFYTHQYSHSDYIESLTNTGLIGFILYQSFFVIIFYKACVLIKKVRFKTIRFYILMSALIVIIIKFIAFGIILYFSPQPIIIMACIMSYLSYIEKKYKMNQLNE